MAIKIKTLGFTYKGCKMLLLLLSLEIPKGMSASQPAIEY